MLVSERHFVHKLKSFSILHLLVVVWRDLALISSLYLNGTLCICLDISFFWKDVVVGGVNTTLLAQPMKQILFHACLYPSVNNYPSNYQGIFCAKFILNCVVCACLGIMIMLRHTVACTVQYHFVELNAYFTLKHCGVYKDSLYSW